jgi:hypothetical protein
LINQNQGTEPFVSIHDINSNHLLKVYPNPAAETVTITFNDPNVDLIQIRDLNGKIIRKDHYHQYITVDTAQMESGLYLLELYNSDNKSFIRQKIMVSH